MLPDPPASAGSNAQPDSKPDNESTEKPTEVAEVKSEQAQIEPQQIETLAPPAIVTTDSSSTESTTRPTHTTPTINSPTPPTAVILQSPPESVPLATTSTHNHPRASQATRAARPSRPPILLDLAIVSLVSIFIAILARRIL